MKLANHIVCDSPIASRPRNCLIEPCGQPATHFYKEVDGLSARCDDHRLTLPKDQYRKHILGEPALIQEIDEATYRVFEVMES